MRLRRQRPDSARRRAVWSASDVDAGRTSGRRDASTLYRTGKPKPAPMSGKSSWQARSRTRSIATDGRDRPAPTSPRPAAVRSRCGSRYSGCSPPAGCGARRAAASSDASSAPHGLRDLRRRVASCRARQLRALVRSSRRFAATARVGVVRPVRPSTRGEDGLQAVVVFLADRVELVVVAAGALRRSGCTNVFIVMATMSSRSRLRCAFVDRAFAQLRPGRRNPTARPR